MNSAVIIFHSKHLVVNFYNIFNVQVEFKVLYFLDLLMTHGAMSWSNIALHFGGSSTLLLELTWRLRDNAEVLLLDHLLLALVEELLDVSVQLVVLTHFIHLIFTQRFLDHVVLHGHDVVPAGLSIHSILAAAPHCLRLHI